MGRQKRKSIAVDKAKKRLDGMKSIDPNLDLGNGLTVAAYSSKIKSVTDTIDSYNTLLSTLDDKLNDIIKGEKGLGEFGDRMLSAVGAKYGFDSDEYEMAGGTRKSEKKKPARKPKA